MVPLEKLQQRRRSAQAGARASELRRKSRRRRQPVEPVPEEKKPRQPRRFKVVDVMTRQTLAEGEGVRRTLELLGDIRSVVDVIVYVWDREEDGWRPLTMREQKVLWERRTDPALR